MILGRRNSSFIKSLNILATCAVGAIFFFTIIGVFGLPSAIGGLVLAILIALVITKRAPRGSDLL
jgi:hypothetical protein